ncbi:MAG: hypothetical protein EBV15_07035 [Bacteroidetes bacterium]|nr:hypothetical protein [Bacteroidota bacterium]
MQQSAIQHCDFLFAGAGASATLLMLRMEKMGLLAGKKVVLADNDFTSLTTKTFCFWAKPGDEIVLDCRNLIQKRWSYLRIDRGETKALKPLEYHCIPGVNLQKAMLSLAERNRCEKVESSVLSMVSDDAGVLVSTSGGTYHAGHVFDSRPSGFMSPKPNESSLFQSFIGYVIETDQPVMNTDAMDMMDFGVDQQGATQFMYVLPTTANKALVELTRFGSQTIKAEEASPLLEDYIKKHFGESRIIETERGCIPMCSAPLRVHEMNHVTRLGGRAGAIKPGTGYAFKNMHMQAIYISNSIKQNRAIEPHASSARFRFYDRLLLWILSHKPELGKPIFQQLFKRNNTPRILRFLDEKTTLLQDISILSSLPFRPFLAALKQDLMHHPPAVSKSAILSVVAVLLWFFYSMFPAIFMPMQWFLLSAGLLAVGIPHGAVDHLLGTGKIHARPAWGFILKYLGIMLIYLLLWQMLPSVALVIFLLYSAFHFGQSDIQEWKIRRFANLKSLIWGLIILDVILFSHGAEVSNILHGMNIELNQMPGEFVCYFSLLTAILWAFYEKKTAILWSVFMLLIGMHLPVLSAFGLYFIGQHSLNGWSHLRKGMQAGNKELFMKALPFTVGAISLLAVLLCMAVANILPWKGEQWISVFFVFLACLSMPHVWAMHRFYQKGS